MNLKEIKKALFTNRVRLSKHSKERMEKRGYTKKDIISCLLSGSIVERQVYNNQLNFVIEGEDADQLPIALVVGRDYQPQYFVIVTVMPPLNEKFKRVI